MYKQVVHVALLSALFGLSACSNNGEPLKKESLTGEHQPDVGYAVSDEGQYDLKVDLKNSTGEIVGHAFLSEGEKGVKINLAVRGLQPGQHGFHIHEIGKCLAPHFQSAGGHFNPNNTKHGHRTKGGPHAGDLPNVEADKKGMVKATVIAKKVTLQPGAKHSLLDENGSALVIHERADDGKSQPSGAAGKRVICGEISGE